MLKRLISTLIGTRFGTAEVRAVNHITPHMIRVTLKSDIIANFSEDCAGAHLKLVVPDKDQSDDHFADMIEEGAFKREMRTYTIRHARPSEQEIDVDIAVHGDLGRVGPWAQRTQPGDTIVISQCGSPKLITNGISRVLAGADLTSFPALAAGLETLPEKVQVEAFVEIPGPEDEQPADLPAGISINWIIKPDPHAPSDDLISALRNAPAPDEETSVFVAGEFSTVADLRQHFRRDLGVDKHRLYISSYWKAGLEEPDHAAAKAVSVS